MLNSNKIQIAPSLICTDLCNIEKSVKELESMNIKLLHIDLIDGYFSPSMPIGLDMIRQLRKITKMDFNVHIMVKENEFFIEEFLKIGVQQLCFHLETAVHADRLLALIRNHGVKAGIAITPATPVSMLEYVIERCDFVMLMLINPGYAGSKTESQVPYACKKVSDCYKFIKEKGLNIPIEIDGRVSLENIPSLVKAGADILVAGSSCLFKKNGSLYDNLVKINIAADEGLKRRKGI